MEIIKLILDQSLLDEYYAYYFLHHPKAKKKPIDAPRHPSINQWSILPRIQMNALKQRWKDFGCWWIQRIGYQNMRLNDFKMTFTTYMPTKRRIDPDNTVPKFILDAFVESGFIVDDDSLHLKSLTLKTAYDKKNPRTEIEIFTNQHEYSDNAIFRKIYDTYEQYRLSIGKEIGTDCYTILADDVIMGPYLNIDEAIDDYNEHKGELSSGIYLFAKCEGADYWEPYDITNIRYFCQKNNNEDNINK